MKRTILILSLLFATQLSFAQFGITGGYRYNDATFWTLGVIRGNFEFALEDGYSIGVDYWFRLKNYRVEFLPEFNFSSAGNLAYFINSKMNTYSLFANVNVYPFDFLGDCDCPTWSKQGNFFQKGFFVQVSPGVSYLQQELQISEETIDSNASTWSIGGGIGFDIGITDLVTFSPIIGARYYGKTSWDGLAAQYPGISDTDRFTQSAIKQLFAGARLGIRLDYKK